MSLKPADFVIKSFGGVRATARAIGRSPSSVSKWRQTKEKRGCGGSIPAGIQKKILDEAKKRGLTITAADLILGHQTTRKRT